MVLMEWRYSSWSELRDHDSVPAIDSSLGVGVGVVVCREAGLDCGTDTDPLAEASQTTIVWRRMEARLVGHCVARS